MRILFLTPQLPYPPRQGGQIRNYHLLRAAAAAHQVDLLSFVRQGEPLAADSPLRELCGQIKTLPAPAPRSTSTRLQELLLSREPDVAQRLVSRGYAATLGAMAATGGYDLIQVTGIEMSAYLPIVREAAPRSIIVFDDFNAEYRLQARSARVDAGKAATMPKAAYSAIQSWKIKQFETRACAASDLVLAVSQGDAEDLRALGTSTPIAVIPNAVDAVYYRPDESIQPEGAGLLFTGTMDYRPNVDAVTWFATNVLPDVRARRPDATFTIVGRTPAPAVQRLAATCPGVTVTGPVDDVRPYFSRASLYVMPIRMGGGSRLKLLEALAMGMPVVTTSVGAEGVDLRLGEEALLADSAGRFANSVVSLLDDWKAMARLSHAARQAAEERFGWEAVGPLLLAAYGGLA